MERIPRGAEQAGGLDDVSALAVGGQQHGMVILDNQGNVIRDAMLWNDTSSAPQAAALIESSAQRPHKTASRKTQSPEASSVGSRP